MKNNKKKFNRAWYAISIFLIAFIVLLPVLHHNLSRAAEYTFVDSEGTTLSSTYDMRRATDRLTVNGLDTTDTCAWTSANTDILTVDSSTASSSTVKINAVSTGTVALNLVITHADGTTEDFTIKVTVEFSINEYLSGTTSGVKMTKIKTSDTRKSLVMNYGSSIYFGSSAVNEPNKINLIFGNALNAEWTSSNEDVFRINEQTSGSLIAAVGAGKATLSVSYNDGTKEYTDSITVYVRPQLTYNGSVVGSSSSTSTVTMEDGDYIGVSASFSANPLESISDKLVWVISEKSGEDTVLVRDSLGNKGDNYKNANLTFSASSCSYKFDAKAGAYTVQFYVKGTYTDFDTAKETVPGCAPENLGVTVNSEFTDKDKTITIGGSYSLTEAFNIPLETLKKDFTVTKVSTNPSGCVSFNTDTMIFSGDSKGKAVYTVSVNSGITDTIPGLTQDSVTITINVSENFELNISEATVAVGSTISLSGIIGSGTYAEATAFKWTTSDTNATYTTLSTNGQNATVTGKKTTLTGSPVEVTLAWTDDEGVTLTASCKITVTNSAETLTLNKTSMKMQTGEIAYLDTGLTGTQNITWISSDTDIVTVDAQSGNVSAKVTAGSKSGSAIITAINKDNNVYATCTITVVSPITSLAIDKGETYSTYLSSGYIFMKAVYAPTDATVSGFTWKSSNSSVATVDNNGVVTLVSEGQATISVKSDYDTNGVGWAQCILTVKSNPITKITTDVSKLSMIKGESYTVATTLTAQDEKAEPTDSTLTWTSADSSIAKVEGGVITATGVGTTTITVTGGNAFATILVTVRNKITSIAFDSSSKSVAVGGKLQLNVTFTPSSDVNKTLSWTSSDTSVVTISDTGEITGVSVGYAVITCVSEDLGITGAITCMIQVTNAVVDATDFSILPSDPSVYAGSTTQLSTKFTPDNTTNTTVTWSSSDKTIATIDDTGLVTGVASGQALITAVYTGTTGGTTIVRSVTISVHKALVSLKGMSITPTSKEMQIGEKFTITPAFTPADATNKNVTYTSLDKSVITVDSSGVVTAVASGSSVIICQAADGGYVATCNVKVLGSVAFSISPTTRDIAIGKSFTLKKKITPDGASKEVTYKSSNENIAVVNENGTVTGVKKGTCTITATLTEYNLKAKCKVKVGKLYSKISLNKKAIRINRGQTYKLKATVKSNAVSLPEVKFKSKNPGIVKVNSNGKIKAKKVGTTYIYATTKDSIKATVRCKVVVVQRASSIVINKTYIEVYVGGSKQLSAKVEPSGTTIKKVKWYSQNSTIAAITSDGKVRGSTVGETYVYAKTTDGSNKIAKCRVSVVEPVAASSITIAQSSVTMKTGDSMELTYKVLPSDCSEGISFASDNNRVAKVTDSGKVKAVGTGTCTITIMSDSGITSTVTVEVVELSKSYLSIRQYDSETLEVLGVSSSDTVVWYTSNSRVATVSNGTIVGKSVGSCYVYAYVNGCKMACVVNITKV